MDPLTHTLVGANLAATPAARRAGVSTAAMVVAANLPDVDVLSFALGGDFALGFRRGLTHGFPALVLLPLLLWGVLLFRRRAGGPTTTKRWRLLAFCWFGVWSHPALDWLNTYGMRWRMPLDGTWSYGDSLFIIDPWLWLLLGGGWLLARRVNRRPNQPGNRRLNQRGRSRPTRRGGHRFAFGGLAAAVLWIGLLLTLHQATESRVAAALESRIGTPLDALLVGPRPANPLAWDVVARSGERYHLGRWSWRDREIALSGLDLRDARTDPLWPEIMASGQAAGFLEWVRYPWLEVEESAGALEVYVMDARYRRRRTTSFGGARIRLPPRLLPSNHPQLLPRNESEVSG